MPLRVTMRHRCTEAPRAAPRDRSTARSSWPSSRADGRFNPRSEGGNSSCGDSEPLMPALTLCGIKPQTADKRHRAQVAARLQRLLVGRLQPQRGQMVGDAPIVGA